jgi:hypothetical protein
MAALKERTKSDLILILESDWGLQFYCHSRWNRAKLLAE